MSDEPRIPKQKKSLTLDAALKYLNFGWNVIPVRLDKRPHLPSWEEYQRRRVTEEEIREWWGRWPNAGIAVLTGALSGIVVIDADDAEGMRNVAAHMDKRTWTATTGGGGKHYYFKHPGSPVPCAVRFLPGVDCRGDGGYVVAPPSPHKSGRFYRWDQKKAELSVLPKGLLDLLRHPKSSPPAGDKAWLLPIPEGRRDDELTRRAGRLFQAGLKEVEVMGILRAVNQARCRPPLDDAQIIKIVRSIAHREGAKKASPEPKFAVVTQREMLRKYGEDQMEWAVSEWLPEASCGLLVAPPGNYKTWILAALGFSVATGRPFLGRWPVRSKGPVLFIQQEDPWNMLESRLSRMFEQLPPTQEGDSFELDGRFCKELDEMPVYWYTDRRLHFGDKGVLSGMEQRIAELKPRVVMIDPLYTAVDSRDYMAEGAQRMTTLKLMRDVYGCSFVIAHHTTVAGGTSTGRESIWGSQFLNAWLEFGWRIPKGDRHGNIIIRHFKGAGDLQRVRIKFLITDFGFRVEIDEHHTQTVAERVEEMMSEGGEITSIREVARVLGCSKSVAQRILRRMDLKKDGKGRYTLPE